MRIGAILALVGTMLLLAEANAQQAFSQLGKDTNIVSSGVVSTNHEQLAGRTEKPVATGWPLWVRDLIALVSVLVIVYLFIHQAYNHSRERTKEYHRAVSVFWIQDLILKPNIQELHAFFNKYESELTQTASKSDTKLSNATQKRATERILQFKSDYHNLKQRVVEPLVMISPKFQPLQDAFGEFEDLVADEFARMPGVNHQVSTSNSLQPVDRFRDLRRGFFDALHQGQKQTLCG